MALLRKTFYRISQHIHNAETQQRLILQRLRNVSVCEEGGGGLTFQKKVAIFLGLICFLGYFFPLFDTFIYFFLGLQARSQTFLLILGRGDGSETALTRCAFQILDTSEL